MDFTESTSDCELVKYDYFDDGEEIEEEEKEDIEDLEVEEEQGEDAFSDYDITDYVSDDDNVDNSDLYDTSEYDAECERQLNPPPSSSPSLHLFGSLIDPVTRLMLYDLAGFEGPDCSFYAANGSLLDDEIRSMVSGLV